MNNYKKGANVERQAINDHIANGAIFAMRGAGSKCRGKLKIDVIALYPGDNDTGFLFLEQYKKSSKKSKLGLKKDRTAFFKVKIPACINITRKFIHFKGKEATTWQKIL